MKKKFNSKIIIFLLVLVFFVVLIFGYLFSTNTICFNFDNINRNNDITSVNDNCGIKTPQGYKLENMTILSRHNIRSPLSNNESVLSKITPYEWFDWTSDGSELSVLGGNIETSFGQYFRKYLENINHIPKNWNPLDKEIKIMSNSLQRTIATARFFNAGMFPISNVDVSYNGAFNDRDRLFLPYIENNTQKFKNTVLSEINELFSDYGGIDGIESSLKDDYSLLEDILNLKDSEYAQEKGINEFKTDDLQIRFTDNDEMSCSGSLKDANSACDALLLQYYEDTNDISAAFGKNLSYDQWQQIGHILDVYEKLLFGSRTASIVSVHPLLQELKNDIENNDLKLCYLVAHDSTLFSVLNALDVEDYSLPNSIAKLIPIGSKLVINTWADGNGEKFCSASLVYATDEQLNNHKMIDLLNPPCEYQLSFKGITKNSDNLYKYSDFIGKIENSINLYNECL